MCLHEGVDGKKCSTDFSVPREDSQIHCLEEIGDDDTLARHLFDDERDAGVVGQIEAPVLQCGRSNHHFGFSMDPRWTLTRDSDFFCVMRGFLISDTVYASKGLRPLQIKH